MLFLWCQIAAQSKIQPGVHLLGIGLFAAIAWTVLLGASSSAWTTAPRVSTSLAAQQESKAHEWDGEVQSYEPGNLLTIRKLPKVEVKFDLTKKDAVYSIAPGVEKMSDVHVVEQDENGIHHVTVTLQEKTPKVTEARHFRSE